MIRSLLLTVLIAAPAAAQQPRPTTDHQRAIAAGYKALTLCSAVFNAGRTEAQADAEELRGIYPEYQPLLPLLPAIVDRVGASVTVRWSDTLPPRQASWARTKGCTIQPIGAASPPIATRYAKPPAPAPADARAWPMGDAGVAPRPGPSLSAAMDRGFDATGHTIGVVVVKDGRIVAERYRDGWGPFTANRTWSVAKSIAGTIVGVAQQRGAVNVSAPVRIPEWSPSPSDPRRAITTDQLLRMSSGLYSDTAGNRTDAIYFGGTAVTEQTTGWPLDTAPGSRFRYANNDILLAVRGVRAAMADDGKYAALLPEFFATLGMTHSVAETDWRGNYVLSSQVWTTARDLARFGMLYLQDGMWNGKRLLPAGWTRYVAASRSPQPDGEFGYGATFWLMNRSEGVPADTYAAMGNRGQHVVIVPSRNVVIVRRGEDPGTTKFDIARFTADVLAALP